MPISPETARASKMGSAVDIGDMRLACELQSMWDGYGTYTFRFNEARVREQAEMLAQRYRLMGWDVLITTPHYPGAPFVLDVTQKKEHHV